MTNELKHLVIFGLYSQPEIVLLVQKHKPLDALYPR